MSQSWRYSAAMLFIAELRKLPARREAAREAPALRSPASASACCAAVCALAVASSKRGGARKRTAQGVHAAERFFRLIGILAAVAVRVLTPVGASATRRPGAAI